MEIQTIKGDILIVEDQPDNLRFLTKILHNSGHRPRQAIDGEMALIAIETLRPDLLLLDINIPHCNGYELGKILKQNPQTADIPIIFLSGFEEDQDKIKVLKMGAADYLQKPYQAEEVIAKVNNYLRFNYLQKELKTRNNQLQKKLRLQEAAQQFYANPQINSYLLQKAIAATLNGIMITDATQTDHPIIYVNEGFERMTGYSQEEMLEKNPHFLLGSDKEQQGLNEIYQAIKNSQACCVILRNYRKNGTLFWNEISLSPVKDDLGQLVYYIWIQTDISERIKAEEEKQRYESSLKRMNYELQGLTEKLRRLANLDGLTELANRRNFDEYFEQEWKNMARQKQPLSLILGDIDYFKKYNDHYGHIEGDNCLKAVAKAIQSHARRPTDLVARWGGEEFAILLPNTPLQGAQTVATSILEHLQALGLPHQASLVQPYVTMSLGIATLIPHHQLNPNQLIATADAALLEAKEKGRNQYIIKEII